MLVETMRMFVIITKYRNHIFRCNVLGICKNHSPEMKGKSSDRVRSGPSARAIESILRILLSLHCTSSCFSSSIRMAIGYKS